MKALNVKTQSTKILKQALPPILWRLIRKIAGREDQEHISYQGIQAPFFMTRLHEGQFADIHEKWALLDKHINGDLNHTRLRVYTVCSFAQLALNNNINGAILSAGVSFGTAALISAEYLNLENQNRDYYLIDPFDGSNTSSDKSNLRMYNTNFDLIQSRWNNAISTKWIREFLSPEVLREIETLSFVHLNTGDYDSELECLPIIFEKLVPGAFMVLDLYGWQTNEKQKEIDCILNKIGASSFLYITRQLIIYKPANLMK